MLLFLAAPRSSASCAFLVVIKTAVTSAHHWLLGLNEHASIFVRPTVELHAAGISDHDLLFSQPDHPANAAADGQAPMQRQQQQQQQHQQPCPAGTPSRRRALAKAANAGDDPQAAGCNTLW